jgi:hypothetical protein
MKRENMKNIFRSFLAVATFALFTSASFTDAQQSLCTPGKTMDAIGEFLRSINTLSAGIRALPVEDPLVENIRARFEIPVRIPIISPRGGTSMIVFVFDNERLPLPKGVWNEMLPHEYRYLQTYHNLKAVYCLHEKEPVDLGDIVFAVEPGEGKNISVFFNNKQGAIDRASIEAGNAVFFSGSRYIVKPVRWESAI